MKKIVLTDEQIADIIYMYQDKSVRFSDICEKYGLSSNTIIRVIDSNNIPRRQKRHKKRRVCSHCGGVIELSGARYCPFCGRNIMTESEQLIEELRDKISLLELLPSTDRDDFRNVLLKAINYIKEECRDTK